MTQPKAWSFSAKSLNPATLVDQSDHAHAVTKVAASRESEEFDDGWGGLGGEV